MKASRRGLFSIAGAGLVSAGPVKAPWHGAASWAANAWGLNVSLRWFAGGWEVAVIDDSYKWVPGEPPPLKWIPLDEYLSGVERECGVIRRS